MNSNVSKAGYLNENYRYFHLRDTAGQERDFHFHDFDKLVFLLEGNVEYAVEGTSYNLGPRDVLLVRHHTIHKANIDISVPYDRIIIYINRSYIDSLFPNAKLMECFDNADRDRSYLFKPTDEQFEDIMRVAAQYEQSEKDNLFGSKTMCDTCIVQFLIHMGRLAKSSEQTDIVLKDPKIEQVLSYINEHFNEQLTVEQLADEIFLSRYHFMRLFKAQMGTTVHAYIRQKRLMHATRLIREGVSAAKAATDSGFTDYSTFHRAFKETFGTAPGKLKSRPMSDGGR